MVTAGPPQGRPAGARTARTASYDPAATGAGRWHYGATLDVRPGDIWTVAEHVLVCGDLEGVTPLPAVLAGRPPAAVYVDPPWSAGLATGYRTKAAVDGPKGRPVDFVALLDAILAVPAAHRAPTFIEGSSQPAFLAALDRAVDCTGGQVVARWPITYYQHRQQASLTLAHYGPNELPAPPSLDYLDEAAACSEALTWLLCTAAVPDGSWVLDPCCGRGMVPVACEDVGLSCVGHELAPARLAVTIEKLARLTGQGPTLTYREEGT